MEAWTNPRASPYNPRGGTPYESTRLSLRIHEALPTSHRGPPYESPRLSLKSKFGSPTPEALPMIPYESLRLSLRIPEALPIRIPEALPMCIPEALPTNLRGSPRGLSLGYGGPKSVLRLKRGGLKSFTAPHNDTFPEIMAQELFRTSL